MGRARNIAKVIVKEFQKYAVKTTLSLVANMHRDGGKERFQNETAMDYVKSDYIIGDFV